MKETLGYRLKRERVLKKYTQEEMANMLNTKNNMFSTVPVKNINKGMISKWENDKDLPSLSNLRHLSSFFNRPMDYFAVTDDLHLDGLGQKMKHARERAGLTVSDVAQTLGIFESDWLRYENENDSISRYLIDIFCEQLLGLQYFEFMNDIGLYDEYIPPEFDGNADAYETFKAAREQDWKNEATTQLNKIHRVPLLGTIAAGAPILADEHVDEYIEISLDVKADFALRVQGDSMIGANIYDGDIVFIHQQPSVENGEIAAVMLIDPDTSDGVATLKRVYKTANSLQLVPENRNYAPIIVNEENGAGAKILGKATYHITQVR